MYDQSGQFEPLLPASNRRDGLLEKAHHLQRLALAAKGRAHASVMLSIAPLLRAMNSYYTNRIEGQHTLPIEIEQALRQDFAANADTRRRQRLAVAHMHAEAWAEAHARRKPTGRACSSPRSSGCCTSICSSNCPRQTGSAIAVMCWCRAPGAPAKCRWAAMWRRAPKTYRCF